MNIKKYALAIAFTIDGIIAIGFGIFSLVYPNESFGSIFSIPEGHDSLFLSLFSSLSLFYIMIGMVCFVGVESKYSTSRWIAVLMVLRHFFEGVIKIGDMNEEWLIGNPYPDLIIHAILIFFYLLFIYRKWDMAHIDSASK